MKELVSEVTVNITVVEYRVALLEIACLSTMITSSR